MLRYFITVCLLFFVLASQAQAPNSAGPTPDSSSSPAAVPLDGGASLLLAGGAAYGLRRLQQLRRRA